MIGRINALMRRRRDKRLAPLRAEIAARPLEPAAHRALGEALAGHGRDFAAHALLRSAAHLAGQAPDSVDRHRVAAERLLEMNHNQSHRFRKLAAALRDLADGAPFSLLDIGGGEGQLAQYLPEASYMLVEPGVNGITGQDLAFAQKSFDYVVACHVLEHVPRAQRADFLDSLMARASRALVLLNPFQSQDDATRERLELFVEVMNAGWAREHLECEMPYVEDVRRWAEARGLAFEAAPDGMGPLSVYSEFADYFARSSLRGAEVRRVNRYVNSLPLEHFDSPDQPNAWLIKVSRP